MRARLEKVATLAADNNRTPPKAPPSASIAQNRLSLRALNTPPTAIAFTL